MKAYIRQGRVEIDGVLAKKPETKVDEGKQKVSLDGREIPYQKYEYYMLNKPAGVITATTDGREQTVLDLLGEKTPSRSVSGGKIGQRYGGTSSDHQ